MKFNERWLREWVNPGITTEELVKQLTMAGLEVDTVTPAAPEFTGVVVGHVVECGRHPDADKLSVCKVDVNGDELLNIVCGAPNVRKDLKVAVAVVGAKLPGDFKIKKAKLRGVESRGMICSATELGIDIEHNGIMELENDAPVGQDFREYYQLDDHIIDIELTPDRGDCLSIAGIAREVGVLNDMAVNQPDICPMDQTLMEEVNIDLQTPEKCPRYVGRIIRNINMDAKTPLWMSERLRRCGIRCIHPIVDICNYVMLEFGQPMHAFDVKKLELPIVIREAKAGEKINLLDEQSIELQAGTLIIADQKGPQAIAGVMGGDDSAVTDGTTDILLESAFFTPVNVRLDARRYGLQTDSSYRFERGVDYQLQTGAVVRATNLILEILGGDAASISEAIDRNTFPTETDIALRADQIERLLGISIDGKHVMNYFHKLGFNPYETDNGWKISVPSYRYDLEQEADLLEELARIYGYDNIPAKEFVAPLRMLDTQEQHLPLAKLHQTMRDMGYSEAITYSFIDPEQQKILFPDVNAIQIDNPIASDMAVMRESLWPGLLSAAMYNLNRQQPRVRLFETGLRFHHEGDAIQQTPTLSFVATGSVLPEQWGEETRSVDFFDVKGDVEKLLGLSRQDKQWSWEAGNHPALHPGQSTAIKKNGQIVGHLGAIHPKIAQQLGLTQVVFVFEIDLQAISEAKLPYFEPVSKFPAVRRDLALLLDQSISAAAIQSRITEKVGELLIATQIFDVYQGEGIEKGKKSVALGLTFQDPSRTLVDEEINSVIQDVIADLEKEFNAQLRA